MSKRDKFDRDCIMRGLDRYMVENYGPQASIVKRHKPHMRFTNGLWLKATPGNSAWLNGRESCLDC